MFITAQVLMTLSILFLISCFFAKNKIVFFLLHAMSYLFFALQYVFLSAWAGFFCALAELVRVILFFFYTKHNVKKSYQIITLVITFIVTTALTIATWAAWYSVLPLIGLASVYLTLFFKKLSMVKIGLLICATCSTIYLVLIHSYYGAAIELVSLIIGFVGFIKDVVVESRAKKLQKTQSK